MRGCNSFQLVSFTSDAHSFAAKIFEVLLSSELLFYNFLPPLTYWKLDLVYGRVTIQEGDADLLLEVWQKKLPTVSVWNCVYIYI